MSNKLNAKKLAAKRWPESGPTVGHAIVDDSKREAYAEAIREHSQPIADERDEYRGALEKILQSAEGELDQNPSLGIDGYRKGETVRLAISLRAILAKYTKR